jgi:nitrogen fixation NifU-like protein
MSNDLESRIEAARLNPQNLGEMPDADGVGTVGSADCGDMLRMWVKFKQREDGAKVIDKATFQSFGCQTAIAVASVATELLVGKTAEEALKMSPEDLSAPLGALPPMKIHCAQLVEGALKQALDADTARPAASAPAPALAPTLHDQLLGGIAPAKAPKIVFRPKAG